MEYRGISPQHLFVMGDREGVAGILRDVISPKVAYLATKPETVPALSERYRVDPPTDMVRMVVDRDTFRPVLGDAVRLDVGDTRHLNRLYELGLTALAAAGGGGRRHLLRRSARHAAHRRGRHARHQPTYGLAAVGNVYTHRDYRGQGFAKVVTSAVTGELLGMLPEVVLNVRADNPPALAAYRALGYREHTHFEERLVNRRSSLWDSIVTPIRQVLSRPRSDA